MNQLPINRAKLQKLAALCRHLDIEPFFVHESCQKPGHPATSLLGELMEECRLCLAAMDPAEVSSLIASLPPALTIYIDDDPTIPRDQVLLERIARYYLVAELWASRWSFHEILTTPPEETPVLTTFPELRDRLDEDGLLYLDSELLDQGMGIEYKDHILHYHQFLRRGYRGTPNHTFLDRLALYHAESSQTNHFRVAIDLHRLTPKEFYSTILEEDTWFGPPFDRSRLDDPRAVGLTVVKRVSPSLFDRANSLDRTEFYWKYADGVKTLETEELSREGRTFDSYYLNRYTHTERDATRQVIRHFDGAVKVYTGDSYSARIAARIPNEPRSHKKVKLFRIDGDIDADRWADLLACFYRDNEMVLEYLNAEEYEQRFGERNRAYRQLMLGTADRQ